MKRIVKTNNAPQAIGPYSQAIRFGNLVFVSGQLPVDPATGSIPENIGQQTKQVMENIGSVLEAAGLNYQNVIKTTCFLSDMRNFPLMNNVYETFFTGDFPSRSTIAVRSLPRDVLVEIECIAGLKEKAKNETNELV